jgi:transposase InsO family protein
VFIDEEKARYSISLLCRVMQVSRSGFYAWGKREPSLRGLEDTSLSQTIAEAHRHSRGTYGSPRIHAELRASGRHVGRKRVARLMRRAGIAGLTRRRYRCTTDSRHDLPVAANLVRRRFEVSEPNRVWVADITYVWTWEGWMYLAVIVDLFSRRVVGWATADHMRTDLVLEALARATGERVTSNLLVHHSDRGSQYASGHYRHVLAEQRITCSMSRRGNCWDNAVVESFFATLKAELIDRQPWTTRRQAQDAINEYIGSFYNSHRLHSHLGYLTPSDYERRYEEDLERAA